MAFSHRGYRLVLDHRVLRMKTSVGALLIIKGKQLVFMTAEKDDTTKCFEHIKEITHQELVARKTSLAIAIDTLR